MFGSPLGWKKGFSRLVCGSTNETTSSLKSSTRKNKVRRIPLKIYQKKSRFHLIKYDTRARLLGVWGTRYFPYSTTHARYTCPHHSRPGRKCTYLSFSISPNLALTLLSFPSGNRLCPPLEAGNPAEGEQLRRDQLWAVYLEQATMLTNVAEQKREGSYSDSNWLIFPRVFRWYDLQIREKLPGMWIKKLE